MSNLLRLSRRRWLTDYRSHLASVVIAAAVLTAWLLYWGYMSYMGASMAGRVARSSFPADFSITAPAGSDFFMSDYYAETLQSYRALEMETPLGKQPVAAVYFAGKNAPLPAPNPGEVYLPESMRDLAQTAVGDRFQLCYQEGLRYQTLQGTVAGFYSAYDYYPAIVVNADWLGEAALADAEEVMLFRKASNFGRWNGRLLDGVTMQTATTIAEQATKVVGVAFSNGGQGVGLLFLFMVLGVGTFSLLSYMDSRRELALLKSMGLRPTELSLLFALESAFTAVLGVCVALLAVVAVDSYTLLPISLSGALIFRSLELSLLAFAAATAVPFILAQRATVNELLLNRAVPLVRRSVTGLARQYPALQSWLDAGFQLVKLPTVDGNFQGICFRQAGQTVKAGETLAWEGQIWGMSECEYLSPCDGELVKADLEQGLLVIKPM